MKLISIQVGKPRAVTLPQRGDEKARVWRTGYGKAQVAGPLRLDWENLEGDGQADKRYHGGREMAVLAYAASHYPRWREELAMPELPFGAFAENLTVEGVDEEGACLGDVWEVGEVQLQITQPRKPCNNIAKYWDRKDLLARVVETGRHGWYMRALRVGLIEAGAEIRLAARPHPEWTVARAMEVRLSKSRAREAAALLRALPELGEDWRRAL